MPDAESAPTPPIEPPTLTRAARTVALLGIEGASLGLGVWAIVSSAVLTDFVRSNEVPLRERIFEDMWVAAVAAFVLAGAVVVAARRRGLAIVERLARRAAPVTVAGVAPLLFDRELWRDRYETFLPLVMLVGACLVASLRLAARTEPAFARLGRLRGSIAESRAARAAVAALRRPLVPLAVVIAAAAGYAVLFSVLSIIRHRNFGTHAFDMALEENLLWQLWHGGRPLFKSTPFANGGTHFRNHATLFAFVLAPIYGLVQRTETLLVLQATLLGAAAIPLYLYAARRLPRASAALVACAYLVYPALHGANLYDFHYLPLGVVFLWLALYGAERGSRTLTVVAAVAALSVREDVAACLCVIGLFLLFTGASAKTGAVMAVAAGVYFLGMKMAIMPYLGEGDPSFINQYEGLIPKGEEGYGAVLKTLVTNPGFSAGVVLQPAKILYVLELLTPLLFVPMTRPIAGLLVLPGVLFTLLSTGYEPLYKTSFQYTTYWTAFLFVGLVYALEHAGRPRAPGDGEGTMRRRTLLAGVAAASLVCTNQGGAILHRDDVRAGFDRITLRTTSDDLEARARVASLVAQIPPDAAVVASERLLPQVAARASAYRLTQSAYDAEWLLFENGLGEGELQTVKGCLADGAFGIVDLEGPLVLARRGVSTARNEAVLRHLGLSGSP